MADQQQGEVVDAAAEVIDEEYDDGEESSMGETSPDRVLPLDAVKSLLIPEFKDEQYYQDIPECALDTIDDCITEATVRLAFESANNATADGKRKVINEEDVTRAIDGLCEKDAGPGMVILEMTAVVAEKRRVAAMMRRRDQRIRREKAAEQRVVDQEEGASGAGSQN